MDSDTGHESHQPIKAPSQTSSYSSTSTRGPQRNTLKLGSSSSATMDQLPSLAYGATTERFWNPAGDYFEHEPKHGASEKNAVNSEVSIIVRDHTFKMNRQSLETNAGFFKLSLRSSGGWVELLNNTFKLPTFSPTTFKMFQCWVEDGGFDWDLCSGNWFTRTSPSRASVLVGNKQYVQQALVSTSLDGLVECYVLGDYLDAPGFQNEAMDQLSELYSSIHYENYEVPLHNIRYIWENTSYGSLLLRLLMDALQFCLSKKTLLLAAGKGLIPGGLAVALAAEGLERAEPVAPWSKYASAYHLHPKIKYDNPDSNVCSCTCLPDKNWVTSWDTVVENFSLNHEWE
ncbi:hypothetical protein BDZ45DRAFT_753918 [Acephala macrosclerotiorum]|nr:hypothetical protein BDZ45DRAFT_753918 [Acephala macrosclerotiorum]